MKRYSLKLGFVIVVFFLCISCKGVRLNDSLGDFTIKNNSDKIIQFIWITPEDDFFPVAQEIELTKDEEYRISGLKAGIYDVAIDFLNEPNSFNSKKDPSLKLVIREGTLTLWTVNENGQIER